MFRVLFFSFLLSLIHSPSLSLSYLYSLLISSICLPSQNPAKGIGSAVRQSLGVRGRGMGRKRVLVHFEVRKWRLESAQPMLQQSSFPLHVANKLEGRAFTFRKCRGGVPLQFKHCETVVLVVFYSVTASLICETLCLHLLPSQVLLHSKNP